MDGPARCRPARHSGLPSRGGLAAGCRLTLDGCDDPVVPGQDERRIGVPETERLGHHGRGQRPGHGPAELGVPPGRDRVHQAAGLSAREGGQPGTDLIGPEGTGERSPVPGVLGAVEREHARPDHLGRGEPGIIDRERPRITHDLDRQVVPGDHPGAQDRYPADRRGRPEPGEHRMRIRLQLSQRDHVRRRSRPGHRHRPSGLKRRVIMRQGNRR